MHSVLLTHWAAFIGVEVVGEHLPQRAHDGLSIDKLQVAVTLICGVCAEGTDGSRSVQSEVGTWTGNTRTQPRSGSTEHGSEGTTGRRTQQKERNGAEREGRRQSGLRSAGG